MRHLGELHTAAPSKIPEAQTTSWTPAAPSREVDTCRLFVRVREHSTLRHGGRGHVPQHHCHCCQDIPHTSGPLSWRPHKIPANKGSEPLQQALAQAATRPLPPLPGLGEDVRNSAKCTGLISEFHSEGFVWGPYISLELHTLSGSKE